MENRYEIAGTSSPYGDVNLRFGNNNNNNNNSNRKRKKSQKWWENVGRGVLAFDFGQMKRRQTVANEKGEKKRQQQQQQQQQQREMASVSPFFEEREKGVETSGALDGKNEESLANGGPNRNKSAMQKRQRRKERACLPPKSDKNQTNE